MLPSLSGKAVARRDIKHLAAMSYTAAMAKRTTLKEIGDMLAHVVKHMATKDDIAELRTELKGDIAAVHTQVNSIERQLRETKTEIRLADIEEKVFGASRA